MLLHFRFLIVALCLGRNVYCAKMKKRLLQFPKQDFQQQADDAAAAVAAMASATVGRVGSDRSGADRIGLVSSEMLQARPTKSCIICVCVFFPFRLARWESQFFEPPALPQSTENLSIDLHFISLLLSTANAQRNYLMTLLRFGMV